MRPYTVLSAVALVTLLIPAGVAAQKTPSNGPVIESAGPVFDVQPTLATPTDMDYRVAFDVSQSGGDERLNQSLNTVARFLNMHARAGVPRDHLGAAVVVHGSAVMDVLAADAYGRRHDGPNPNATLVRELLDAGTRIIVCGQSAASQGVEAGELMDGVDLALSAMTAFVILQADGYRVNPW